MNDIGLRLSQLIETLDITKTEFATKLKVTQPYISKLINKGSIPSDRLIEDICQKFNVNKYWLCEGTGNMFNAQPEEDEVAAYVAELVLFADKENEIKKLIVAIMRTYTRLDSKGKEVIKKCIRDIAEDIVQPEPDE